jgi:iron complex outermembrane receptor protein
MQIHCDYPKSILYAAVVAASVAASMQASPALAQTDAAADMLEEIIVTAQRTEQSVQDVPIAVTALSEIVLEARQIIGPSDLQLNTPNLSFSATNFGSSSMSIRGIGRLVTAGSGEAGVSTHINQIPIGTNLNAIEWYDVKRVEILRGPQGTLFGRNATGGAINMVTNMPSFEGMSGFIDAEVGDYSHQRIKGAFNYTINDKFAIRAAGMSLDRDGYIDNLAHGQVGVDGSTIRGIDDDIDGRDLYSFRVTGRYLSDNADIWLMYSKFSEDDDKARITNQVCKTNTLPVDGCEANSFGLQGSHLGSTTGGIFGGLNAALPLGDAGATNPNTLVNYNYPRPIMNSLRDMHTDFEPVFENDEEFWAFGASFEVSDYTLSLQGAYQETTYLARQDFAMDVGATLEATAANPEGLWPTSDTAGDAGDDWTSSQCNYQDGTFGIFGGCVVDVDQRRLFAFDQSDAEAEGWNIEAKIQSNYEGRFNFVVGASTYDNESYGDYYVNANTLDLVAVYGVAALGFPPLYPGSFNATGNPSGNNKADGWAAFGEAYFNITDALKLTVGVRYNEDNKTVSDSGVLFDSLDLNAALGGILGADALWIRPDFVNFTLGAPLGPDEDKLVEFWDATDAFAAASTTAPLSAERLGATQLVGLVSGFGESRFVTGSADDVEFDETTGRIGLDWTINESSMVYAFFNRGYKPGGFNPPINPAFQATSDFTFGSETVDSFEIGSKNLLLDNRMQLNASVFIYDYSDLQIARIANNTSLNDNIDADIWGVEIEGFWSPASMPALALDFSYSHLKAEVDGARSIDPTNRTAGNDEWIMLKNIDPGSLTAVSYPAITAEVLPLVDAALAVNAALSDANGQTVPGTTYANGIPTYFSRSWLDDNGATTSNGLESDIDGNTLPNSPENTAHLGVQYTWELEALRGSIAARWDYYWQDDSYSREFNTQGDEIDSWDQHNASVTYQSDNGTWQVKGWIRNIADDDNITGHYLSSDTAGFYRNYFLTDPRIYGLSVRASF